MTERLIPVDRLRQYDKAFRASQEQYIKQAESDAQAAQSMVQAGVEAAIAEQAAQTTHARKREPDLVAAGS